MLHSLTIIDAVVAHEITHRTGCARYEASRADFLRSLISSSMIFCEWAPVSFSILWSTFTSSLSTPKWNAWSKVNSHSSTLPSFNALDTLVLNMANVSVMMSTNFVTFGSFFLYFLVSALAMPLTLTRARETAPRGDTHRKTNEHTQCCHAIFQRPCLGHSNKCLATSVDPRSWSTSHAFCCTFLLALAALVASLGPRLGNRLVGEQKAQLEELDTCYNLSSFLGAYENGWCGYWSFWWTW